MADTNGTVPADKRTVGMTTGGTSVNNNIIAAITLAPLASMNPLFRTQSIRPRAFAPGITR